MEQNNQAIFVYLEQKNIYNFVNVLFEFKNDNHPSFFTPKQY